MRQYHLTNIYYVLWRGPLSERKQAWVSPLLYICLAILGLLAANRKDRASHPSLFLHSTGEWYFAMMCCSFTYPLKMVNNVGMSSFVKQKQNGVTLMQPLLLHFAFVSVHTSIDFPPSTLDLSFFFKWSLRQVMNGTSSSCPAFSDYARTLDTEAKLFYIEKISALRKTQVHIAC